jgi:hypothetical protein
MAPFYQKKYPSGPLFGKDGEKYIFQAAMIYYVPIVVVTTLAKCCIRGTLSMNEDIIKSIRKFQRLESLPYFISIAITSTLFALLRDNREYGQDTSMAQSILAPFAMAVFSVEFIIKMYLILLVQADIEKNRPYSSL